MPTLSDAHQLLQLASITNDSVQRIIAEWAKLPASPFGSQGALVGESEANLPSRELFEAQRTLIAATGKLVELVSSPSSRLLEVSSQYNEARCLHIAAVLRIPNLLHEHGDKGVAINHIAEKVGIETRKLARIMRCLCSIHIFREVDDGVFANNVISADLIDNEPLRAYIAMFGWDLYSASDALPRALLDPKIGPSYSVRETAWQEAVGTTKERWNWLEESVTAADLKNGTSGAYPGPFGPYVMAALQDRKEGESGRRPELDIFGLAMLGGGRVFGVAHLFDFPWASLGKAQIVDVGGGVGGFCLQLSKIYPDLSFIVQDRAPVLAQAQQEIWPRENPQALDNGRVQFLEHNFFNPNPVVGADIYWLRYILHDWSDDYCIQILSAIKGSMKSGSRILICDQVMNTTAGFTRQIASAPAPLPANYGYFTRYSHQRDITMMSIINGIERTPAEFQDIIERSGLVMSRIYDCRSQVSLVECTLPTSTPAALNGDH
ncbi:S-adenosyl-L-methionine-dependent methyltransferase [Aspergillus ambiguus]|uniref:S-adenosyl-L-methionine-dependent methyltransferase n=1 Tax=Aspergillus ambiguus TaxID=176160 RepID=UPI003CCD9419